MNKKRVYIPLALGCPVLNLLVDSRGTPDDRFIENLRLLNDILACRSFAAVTMVGLKFKRCFCSNNDGLTLIEEITPTLYLQNWQGRTEEKSEILGRWGEGKEAGRGVQGSIAQDLAVCIKSKVLKLSSFLIDCRPQRGRAVRHYSCSSPVDWGTQGARIIDGINRFTNSAISGGVDGPLHFATNHSNQGLFGGSGLWITFAALNADRELPA